MKNKIYNLKKLSKIIEKEKKNQKRLFIAMEFLTYFMWDI